MVLLFALWMLTPGCSAMVSTGEQELKTPLQPPVEFAGLKFSANARVALHFSVMYVPACARGERQFIREPIIVAVSDTEETAASSVGPEVDESLPPCWYDKTLALGDFFFDSRSDTLMLKVSGINLHEREFLTYQFNRKESREPSTPGKVLFIQNPIPPGHGIAVSTAVGIQIPLETLRSSYQPPSEVNIGVLHAKDYDGSELTDWFTTRGGVFSGNVDTSHGLWVNPTLKDFYYWNPRRTAWSSGVPEQGTQLYLVFETDPWTITFDSATSVVHPDYLPGQIKVTPRLIISQLAGPLHSLNSALQRSNDGSELNIATPHNGVIADESNGQ